jgi:predicted nucleic acid-binding protein
MFLIDSNILVSEILVKYEQDERTLQYRNFYQQIPLIKRVVTDYVLAEFELYMIQVVPSRYQMNAKAKKEIQQTTSEYLKQIINSFTLDSASPSVIKKAFSLYQRFENTHYISFTDSLLLALAQINDYTLITKDKRLNSLAKELSIPHFEP